MEIRIKNPMGANNFDRLANAGLVAGADDSENMKARTEARVKDINELITKVRKVEAHLVVLPTLTRARQLKRLESAATKLKEMHATRLPVGTKKHVESVLNEVLSLQEGVYSSNSPLDKTVLALTASANARADLEAMVESSKHRLERVMADSSDDIDMETFYRNVRDVIQRSNTESTKLANLANKPFIFTRVPVVPIDAVKAGGKLSSISTEKLPKLGFKSDSLAGYPVIHNQLVLGINPAYHRQGNDEVTNTVNDMARLIKEKGFDLEDIKKAVNNLKRVKTELEDIEHAKKAGRKVDPERQTILEKAEQRYTDKIESFKKEVGDPDEIARKGNAVKRRHNQTPATVKEEADKLVKTLSKKHRVKLQMVSEKPLSAKGGFWFWLMPEHELDMLAKASHSGSVKITKWGFAFD